MRVPKKNLLLFFYSLHLAMTNTKLLEMSVADLGLRNMLTCSPLLGSNELISLLSHCLRRDIEIVKAWFTGRCNGRPGRSIHLIFLRLQALLRDGASVKQATTEVKAWATAGGYASIRDYAIDRLKVGRN